MLHLNVDRGGPGPCPLEYLKVGTHQGYKDQMTTLDSKRQKTCFSFDVSQGQRRKYDLPSTF